MKRWLFLSITAAFVALLFGVTRGAPKTGAVVTVRVLSARIMAKPKFIGKTVTDVSRGAHLIYQGKKRGWYQVKTDSGATGWIHKSAVVERKIALSSDVGEAGSRATSDEIELAGRGFTPEVEQEYRTQHADLDFSHVDLIEALKIDPQQVGDFAAEGHVGGDL